MGRRGVEVSLVGGCFFRWAIWTGSAADTKGLNGFHFDCVAENWLQH